MTEREPISSSSRDYGSTAAPPSVGFSEFNATEFYNLTESVANNVDTINSGLKNLERLMKQIGGSSDSVPLREKIHDIQQTVNGSISATARDIQKLGVVARRADKAQKLQSERLTQAFKEALSMYTSVQKNVTEKMAAHMPRQARNRNDPSLMEQQAIADDEESQLLAQEQAQARQVQFETSMLLEREAYMNQMQADVIDVNEIMRQLSDMVKVQGENVDALESNVEAASSNVEAGADELAKAAEYQRRYRRKMFILIIIGIILGIIFIVWMVKAFKG